MKITPAVGQIAATLVDQAVAHLGEVTRAKIQQAAQPGSPAPAGQGAEGGRPRGDPPAELPRRASPPSRRPDAPPQAAAGLLRALQGAAQPEAPRQAPADAGGGRGKGGPAITEATGAVSHSLEGGIAAAHEIAALMATLSHAAAEDSATKKSADQVKTAAQ